MNEYQDEKETYHTEDKVEIWVHVSTPFIWEMALDGRGYKYKVSVVIQSFDSFHGNSVIHNIRVEDKTYKESEDRLREAQMKGKCQDLNYASPRITEKDLGIWEGTLSTLFNR